MNAYLYTTLNTSFAMLMDETDHVAEEFQRCLQGKEREEFNKSRFCEPGAPIRFPTLTKYLCDAAASRLRSLITTQLAFNNFFSQLQSMD